MASIEELKARVDRDRLPRHVAIIMDGNRRWAEARGMPRVAGHREGSKSVRAVTRQARAIGVKALTLYAFSSQNWQRPADEVAALMGLLREYLIGEHDEIMDNGIRLTAIGNIARLPDFVRDPLDALMAESAGNRDMVLCLALSYGGRDAIVAAARAAMLAGIPPEKLDEDKFGAFMPTRMLPPLDLLIRTSGEQRISNFLLWEAAYAELYFTPTLWPDFRRPHLEAALAAYAARERRFGLTSEQLKANAGR